MINSITQNFIQQHQPVRRQNNQPKTTNHDDENEATSAKDEKFRELREQQQIARERMRQMAEDAANAREAAEAQAEHWRNLRIAMEIAGRIMRGDNVPPEDEAFLIEHSPGMYKIAMSARQQKVDPEDHDRLSEEEGGRQAVNTETATASSGQSSEASANYS